MTDQETMLDPLATRLLDAQVRFALDQLRGENYHALVIDEVDHALSNASTVTLNDAVTPKMIKDTAAKYAAQMPVEGAILELAGEIAAQLHQITATSETSVGELLDVARFAELSAAVADTALVTRLLEQVLDSAEFAELCASLIRHTITDGADEARRSVTESRVGRLLAPLGLPFAGAGDRLERSADRLSRVGARFVLNRISADTELLAEIANDLWRRNQDTPVSVVASVLTERDVDDLIVVVFEFWRSFRHSGYFRSLLDGAIDQLFAKYGDVSLYELLAEVGVGREDMIEEALRFGPPVLAMLDERGHLEELLRRRLLPFYVSEEFRAAVAE